MKSEVREFVEGLVGEAAPGPSPSFSAVHLLKFFEVVAGEGSAGRGKIARVLGIGEGVARTLIERLRAAGMIRLSRLGCSLTDDGVGFWGKVKSVFPVKKQLGETGMTLSSCNVALHVKGGGGLVTTGVEQRDAALIAGAKGATTLVYSGGKLVAPKISEDVSKDFPETHRQLVDDLTLEDDDVVVIGSADEWIKADYGAYAAAWTLLP